MKLLVVLTLIAQTGCMTTLGALAGHAAGSSSHHKPAATIRATDDPVEEEDDDNTGATTAVGAFVGLALDVALVVMTVRNFESWKNTPIDGGPD